MKPNYCWTQQILLELVNFHIQCVAFHLIMEISCLGKKDTFFQKNHVRWVSPGQNKRFENDRAEVTNCKDFNRINYDWTPFLTASWTFFIGWLSPKWDYGIRTLSFVFSSFLQRRKALGKIPFVLNAKIFYHHVLGNNI